MLEEQNVKAKGLFFNNSNFSGNSNYLFSEVFQKSIDNDGDFIKIINIKI